METARKILQFVRPGTVIEFTEGSEKEIGLNKLINRLNFTNFQEDSILINFRHNKYSRSICLEAVPLPCLNNKLECHWTQSSDSPPSLKTCTFENIFILDGHRLVVATPELITLTEEGAVFLLPERSLEINYRKTRRHSCEGIDADLIQNGARFRGKLLDFSAVSFRIETESSRSQNFHWINPEVPVQLVFSTGSTTLYSGECRIISQTLGPMSRMYVLEPLQTEIKRFKAKRVRSQRHELLPLPNAVFQHPLSGKMVNLKVIDISGSGVSVQEELEYAVLLPGMILPELELRIGNGFTTKCLAQVIYRKVVESEGGRSYVKCGIAFLDMESREHVNLLSLLYLAKDKHTYISNRVNTEELWQFFFETGFIYPEKYAFVQANKAKLKEMYDRLYNENPSIARHFIYHEKGAILGHMAMLRFYHSSWLVQHHAANKGESVVAGLSVLNQLSNSINDSYNLHSAHMDYIVCYFRPDNKFPQRVFGGAAKMINNKKGCSIDTFAYFHYRRSDSEEWNFAGPWELSRTTAEDLLELEGFYEQESGGLMLHALNLEPSMVDREDLIEDYRKAGFSLSRRRYTLKRNGQVKAIAMVNLSDVGLNLSDLTNCIQLFVVDQEQFPRDIVNLMLSILTHKYQQEEIPILVYPTSYADNAKLPYDKKYSLWAISSHEHASDFIQYLDTVGSRRPKKE